MQTASELGLTEEQHNNYIKLLEFIKANPTTPFNINYFTTEQLADGSRRRAIVYDTVLTENETVCERCLAGLGPLAGVSPNPGETWLDYTGRVYACAPIKCDLYDFLFNCEHENDLGAAQRRLEYFLANGIPEANELSKLEI